MSLVYKLKLNLLEGVLTGYRSLQADLNIKYCEEYSKEVEANQDKKFDINTARVVLDSSDICSMALDMSVENFRFE